MSTATLTFENAGFGAEEPFRVLGTPEKKDREEIEAREPKVKRFLSRLDDYLESKALKQLEKASNPEAEAKMLIARRTTGVVGMTAVAINSIDNPVTFAISAVNAASAAVDIYYTKKALNKWRKDGGVAEGQIEEEDKIEGFKPVTRIKKFIKRVDKYLLKKGAEQFEDSDYPDVESGLATAKKFAKAGTLLYAAASAAGNPISATIAAVGAGAEAIKGTYIHRAAEKLEEGGSKDERNETISY